MKFFNRKTILTFCLAALMAFGVLWLLGGPTIVHALDTGLNFATETGLGSVDPRVTIARIIRIALGFLGVIAVGLMIYAGFVWMMAKGDEEKIGLAKKILISASIGLAIVLASFAIASFVLNRLSESTGTGTSGTVGEVPGGVSDVFLVDGTTPADQSVNVIRNVVIRFHFTKGVKEDSVNSSTFSVKVDGVDLKGQRTTNGNYVEFVPEAACEAPNEILKCFAKNTTVVVEAQNGISGIISLDGKELTCGIGSHCLIQFTTGEVVDTEAPRVNITSQQVCVGVINTLSASSIDNYGVSKIDFFVAESLIGSKINNSNPFVGSPFNADMSWDASNITLGQEISLKVTAYDLDNNYASAQKEIILAPPHCCNGIQDEDETGIDCGGSCLSCEFFNRPIISQITPAGGFCSNDPNKFCRQISEVEDCGANANCDLGTPNGATGNFVTIIGSGFGTKRGEAFFTDAGGNLVEALLADDPVSGNPVCGDAVWQDNQIIVIVPAEADTGKIEIKTTGGIIEASDDEFGPLFNNFKHNTIDRPGICLLSPVKGKLNDVVEYQGIKLASAEAYYGNLSSNLKALVSSFTESKQGTATVPNLVVGATTTFVSKTNVASNFLPFTKESEPYDGPIISSIDPLSGPVGQYVTIRGSGFGYPRGTSKVFFGDETGFEADYNFPEVCTESVWTDKQIIIKVPSDIASGQNYKITIARTGFPTIDSGTQQFNVTSGTPDPGVCRVQPSLGQQNSEVSFWGEYFRDKDDNSIIRFYNNKNQSGQAIIFWAIDESASGLKPWKAITTVHQSAATGPVRLSVGSPAQLSNSLNFTVGQCIKDADCGTGATCCAAGLPEAGKCKSNPVECYGSMATSVFEWRFSTGSEANCAPDQQKCGTVCCSGPCDPQIPNKCAKCLQGQNECGDGSCCNSDCEGGPPGPPSFCPDPFSCSGYSYNQCTENFYCPNSPGLCSPYPGSGKPIPVGQQCDDTACADKPGCQLVLNACYYDATLNRCVKSNTQSCQRAEMRDGENKIIVNSNSEPVVGFCDMFNNDPHWYINWPQSCPLGWSKPNDPNKCVYVGMINGACTKCTNPFSCQREGLEGRCAIDELICPAGSTCDPEDDQCKKPDLGDCDCCCRKNSPSSDCCIGLACADNCGSSSNFGLCTGCVINGVPDDSVCNCFHTTGKFCDDSENPKGVCRDCSAIPDPAKCSIHNECCVDGKNNNRCSGVIKDGSRFEENKLQYCAYYNCINVYPNSCNGKAKTTGVYNKLKTCEQACVSAPIYCSKEDQCANPKCPENMYCDYKTCECKTDAPGPGQPCRNPLYNSCTIGCATGYQCLLPQVDCRCCCKPPIKPSDPDTCKQINEVLSCLSNQGLCTSSTNERGLCCGCSKDKQCSNVAMIGCAVTSPYCCQTRPIVTSRVPAVNETNVCRNTLIEAVFDQKMDVSSFSDNVFLIGDYGKNACPAGYPIVALAERPNGTLAKLLLGLKKIAVNIFPNLLAKPAFADIGHYCYVPGSAVGTEVNATKTKVNFHLTKALDKNIRYYIVLRGDPDLAVGGQEKDYYNENIRSIEKIGMVGSLNGTIINSFNNTVFKNAEIWPFTTGSDICLLKKVKVEPSFQLFQRAGQKEMLNSKALDYFNRPIQPLNNFYAWTWNWSSDNVEIASVIQQGAEPQAEATAGNQQDAQTLGRAKATITVDKFSQPSTVGQSREGTAVLRLFFCENPWPIYYSQRPFPPGYNWPWQDSTTGIEFYYCRDKSGVGTIDDLPALADEPVIKQGGRKICMFGSKVGQTCTSDTNCNNLAGSCLPEVLKEFFFFRENEPGIPGLTGETDSAGKKVNLHWQTTPNTTKYKVYYGLNPGQYVFTANVAGGSGEITKTIDGLVNGLNYYFAVTALSDKNQESIFSNELKLKPTDTTPPAIPRLQASAGDKKITLFWNEVPEAVSYYAYLGVEPRGTGEYLTSRIIRTTPPVNQPNTVFSGLNNEATYYVSVRSIDQYGNISDYAPEITKKPNQPYLISLRLQSLTSVVVKWLPFVSATGYTIYYGQAGPSAPEFVTVSGNTFEKTLTGLTAGATYYITVKANKSGDWQSDASNERSIQLISSNIE